MRTPAPRAAAAALFLLALAVHGYGALDGVRRLVTGSTEPRLPFVARVADGTITDVRPEAAAAGIAPGDRLLEFGGRIPHGLSDLARPLAAARAGDSVPVRVRTGDGRARTVDVVLAPLRGGPAGAGRFVDALALRAALPLFCLCVGAWTALRRPRDPRAWCVFILLTGFAGLGNASLERFAPWPPALGTTAAVFSSLSLVGWPIAMLVFGLIFPVPVRRARLLLRLAAIFLFAPLVAVGLVQAWGNVLMLRDASAAATPGRLLDALGQLPTILMMPCIGGFFAALGTRLGTTKDPDARRRLAILQVGATVGLSPMFILVMRGLFTGRAPIEDVPVGVALLALLLMFLFPLALAYVIVVHRALDVRVVVRQGLQYALATTGVRVMQIVITALVLLALFTGSARTNRPGQLTLLALGVLAVLVIRRVADRVRAITDRRFFRDAYNAEQILTDLSDRLRTMVEAGPLLETVAERIAASLHVERVLCFVEDDGMFRVAASFPQDSPRTLAVPLDGRLASALRVPHSAPSTHGSLGAHGHVAPGAQGQHVAPGAHGALGAHVAPGAHGPRGAHGAHGAIRAGTPGADAALAELAPFAPELVLPLRARERLCGLLALGPKRSEEAYAPSDLRLLGAVAVQAGLALENARLAGEIAADERRRARAAREMEIAREVQERLFPQQIPRIEGLDLAGACRPALGIGGDYYDFIPLADGRLLVVIADVSGKGIGAALLMSGLRAALHSAPPEAGASLAALAARLNHFVGASSSGNRYATAFFAAWDPRTRALTYVNAGHVTPLVLRAGRLDTAPERLETGGPVVGLLDGVTYDEATVTLGPGDLLVCTTDGVCDARDPQDDEFGEARLIDALAACRDLTPDDVIARVTTAVDAFARGAPPFDDMTMVVARGR